MKCVQRTKQNGGEMKEHVTTSMMVRIPVFMTYRNEDSEFVLKRVRPISWFSWCVLKVSMKKKNSIFNDLYLFLYFCALISFPLTELFQTLFLSRVSSLFQHGWTYHCWVLGLVFATFPSSALLHPGLYIFFFLFEFCCCMNERCRFDVSSAGLHVLFIPP